MRDGVRGRAGEEWAASCIGRPGWHYAFCLTSVQLLTKATLAFDDLRGG